MPNCTERWKLNRGEKPDGNLFTALADHEVYLRSTLAMVKFVLELCRRGDSLLNTTNYMEVYYPESRFGEYTDVDGTIAFYLRVNTLLHSSHVVLDVGCGRAEYAEDTLPIRRELRILKGKAAKVIGIDVDEVGSENLFLDEFHTMEATGQWPLERNSVDLCVCDNVLEHIESPDLFFFECRRVLRQGGYLCIRTTNSLSYLGVGSKLIPNRFHARVLNRIQSERKEEDVFPTLYRCNTQRQIRSMLYKYGFEHCVYGYEAEPSYLSFSRLTYLLGVIHQRYAPKPFKVSIFAFARKR